MYLQTLAELRCFILASAERQPELLGLNHTDSLDPVKPEGPSLSYSRS